MLPTVDLHGHYFTGQADAVEAYRKLVASPQVHRVVVCALDLKIPYSSEYPFMSTFCTSNEQLEAFVAQVDSPKIAPFCYVDPREKDAPRQVEHWITRRHMRGVKLYPPEGWYPKDPRCIEVCRVIQDLGVPVLMHMGRVASHPGLRSEFARPIYLEDLGLACPKLKLIIGHFAAPWSLEAVHIAMSFPQWAFDLTTSGHWDLHAIRHACGIPWDPGIGRFVLGTDGCGANHLALQADIAKALREGGFDETQIDQIFHHNGLKVLGEE